MYRVLIVDDEVFIVEGLKVLIDWYMYGFEVCGTAHDGQSAYEKIMELKPELVITDIRMPVMDGLQLINSINKSIPNTNCIVLSGYREFEYVKEAMQGNARGYLLKPVKKKELTDLLTQIKNDLDSIVISEKERYELQKKLSESMPVLKDRYINNIFLDENIKSDDIIKKFDFLGIPYDFKYFMVCLLESDDIENRFRENIKENQLMIFAMRNIIEELLEASEKGILFDDYGGQVGIVFYSNYESKRFYENTMSVIAAITESVEKYLKVKVFGGVSRVHSSLEELCCSYRECRKSLEFRLVAPHNQIITIDQINLNEYSFTYPYDIENEMLNFIEAGKAEKAVEKYGEIIEHIVKSTGSPDFIYYSHINIIAGIIKMLINTGIGAVNIIKNESLRIEKILEYKSLDELAAFIIPIIEKAAQVILDKRKQKVNSKIGEILKYIQENYSQNLTLEVVSKKFFFNPSYLSQLLKKELNKTFLDYLTGVRIKESQKLLLYTDYKVYEVALMVGYTSQRYFSEIFEKHTGLKPSSYKKGS